jgi:hypothetical protein
MPVFVHERSVVAPQISEPHREGARGRLILATLEIPVDRLTVCCGGGLDRQRQPAPWRVPLSIAEDPRG